MTGTETGDRHRVCFLPAGSSGEFSADTTLRDAARQLGLGIETICGGRASCAKCKVRILEGRFEEYDIESNVASAGDPSGAEERSWQRGTLRADERLSCQARIGGDMVVYVPEEARVGRPVVRKEARARTVDLAPAIRKCYVELPAAELAAPVDDWTRLSRELEERFELTDLTIDSTALRSLPPALREGRGALTATLWHGREVIRVEPGYCESAYGLAVDLGTTTVAAFLCDLASGEVLASASTMNPQIGLGEDIMNRIASSRGAEQLEEMQRLVIEAVGELARDVALQASIGTDDIAEVVVVANTVMHHIFLGVDVQALGVAPFAPTISRSVDVKARDLGLAILSSGNVHLLPIQAGFVGADNTAVLMAEALHASEEVRLIIDIGTNGELLLGNRERILSASCPTGPALEGANIKFGMRAAPGAIDRVRIDPETLDVKFSLIGSPRWSTRLAPGEMKAVGLCGSAGIDAVAELFASGLLDRSGRLASERPCDRLRTSAEGGPEFVIAWAEQTAIGQDICITQGDVRAIQLAKGALYAGSRLLLEELGLERPDSVVLAGAFGSVIDLARALSIGLFPDCGIENVSAVGNAAGDGARIALLDRRTRTLADRVAREVEYIELSAQAAFMDAFVDATQIPHATDPFPSLADRPKKD